MLDEMKCKLRFSMNNLQFFAEEPQTPENESDSGAKPTVDEPETNTDNPAPSKTFTQEDLDRIVADRIVRERKKFADYDDIRKKAEEYEKALEEKRLAELSEKERAEEIARKAQEEKAELERKLAEYQAQVEREKINNAFITAATSANIAYIDDALRLADLSSVKVEDGKVVGIEDVVKSLVENKPFLVKQATTQPKVIGEPTHAQQDEVKTIEQQLDEAKAKKDVTKVIELSNKLKGLLGK
ncbi:phage scaffolding protein [Aneurinibacillus aneurinilyticus]|uniref:phage scaffolding protein n=1 Tax=Aneurinibacillus aneurinilyticus TaxID=1391 RepID=UPI0023F49093|nr:phage scaffolding protein [Aneurinibacillus aneurinilyticus]